MIWIWKCPIVIHLIILITSIYIRWQWSIQYKFRWIFPIFSIWDTKLSVWSWRFYVYFDSICISLSKFIFYCQFNCICSRFCKLIFDRFSLICLYFVSCIIIDLPSIQSQIRHHRIWCIWIKQEICSSCSFWWSLFYDSYWIRN